MRNLYIYTLNRDGVIEKTTMEDIKVTRDGKIVEKRFANYKIKQGKYVKKENLNKTQTYCDGMGIRCVEYIAINEPEINEVIKKKLIQPFVENLKKQQNELQAKIDKFENL